MPPQTTSFTTLTGLDLNAPSIVASSVTSGETGVPTNVTFALQLNKPLDPSTLNPANFSLYQYASDGSTSVYVPLTVTLNANLTTLYIAPTQALLPLTQYNIYGSGLTDLSGNAWPGFSATFTTGATPSTTGPAVVATNPENNDTQIATNAPIVVNFNEPVQKTSLGKLTLITGTTTAAIHESFDTTGQIMTITPAAPLLGTSPYTLTIAGVTDMAGNIMTGTTTVKFTTAPSINFSGPSVVAIDPIANSTGIGINVHPHVEFSAPIDPQTLTSSGFYIYESSSGRNIYGTITVAANRMSATLLPSLALLPQTPYTLYVNSYSDLNGNAGQGTNSSFTTATAAITGGTTATQISPASGATGVPLNSIVETVMSTPIDPVTLTNTAITLSPAAPGIVSLASDGQTITLTPSAPLAASTTYTVTVAGFNDAEGNPVTSATSKFITGGAPATGMSVSIVPQSGATGVAVNSTVVASFTSTALNPETVNATTFTVNDGTNGNEQIAGTYATNGGVVTFTPLTPMPGNATINVYVGGILDTAGNNSSGYAQFTTANVADTTPPKVVMATPANGSTNVGLYSPISVTFSKSINPTTLNGQTMTLFNGDTPLTSSELRVSADNRTVSLTPYSSYPYYAYHLPPGAAMTLVVTSGVLDLSGNAAVPFSSTFTDGTPPGSQGPSVVGQAPANGASDVAANIAVTLFVNGALNPSTVPGALQVFDNGVVSQGTVKLVSQNEAIEFTPTTPFGAGDLVQFYLEPTAEDVYGNPIYGAYQGYFTIAGAPANTGPRVVWTNPSSGASNVPVNTPLQVLFDQPINPASLSAASTYFYESNIGSPTVTLSLSANNRILTLTPASGSLDVSASYSSFSVTGLTNVQAQPAVSASSTWYSTVAADTVAPKVLYVTPPNKASAIGTNAHVALTFNKPIDEITANSTTVALTSGGVAIPVTYSFYTGNSQYPAGSQIVVTPQVPLPSSATISIAINGVTSESGVAVAAQTTTFTTLPGPDYGQPYLVDAVTGGDVVPTNAIMTARFSKPIDPSSYNPSNVQIYENFSPSQAGTGHRHILLRFDGDLPQADLEPDAGRQLWILRLWHDGSLRQRSAKLRSTVHHFIWNGHHPANHHHYLASKSLHRSTHQCPGTDTLQQHRR